MEFDSAPGWDHPYDMSLEDGTSGLARAGLVESWALANPVNRAHSEHGISDGMSSIQNDINAKLEAAGEEKIPLVPYLFGQDRSLQEPGDMYGFMADYLSDVKEATPEEKAIGKRYVEEYNKRVASLRAKRPDLEVPDIKQQFDLFRQRQKEAMDLWDATDTSFSGKIGALANAVYVGVNPLLNPKTALANVAAGALTGGGSLLGGLAVQGAANAAIGLAGNLTWSARNRARLNLEGPLTGGDIAKQAAIDFVGGAALHGAGVAVGKAGKFVWGKTIARLRPGEAPPPGLHPEVEAEIRADRDAMAFREDNPGVTMRTTGEENVANVVGQDLAMQPRVKEDIAAIERGLETENIEAPTPPDFKGDLDQAARAIDPEAFGQYDRLIEDIRRAEEIISSEPRLGEAAAIEALRTQADNSAPATLGDAAALEERATRQHWILTAAEEKALWERVRAEQAGGLADFKTEDLFRRLRAAEEARNLKAKAEREVEKLKPALGRAYARAESEWLPSKRVSDGVDDMVARGAKTIDREKLGTKPGKATDRNHATAERERVVRSQGTPNPEDTQARAAAKAMNRASDEADIDMEKSLEALASRIDDDTPGEAFGLSLDQKITTGVDADGNAVEMTVRDFFRENLDDLKIEKAVSVCQISS